MKYNWLISTVRRQRQLNLHEFKFSLVYVASLRPFRATQ